MTTIRIKHRKGNHQPRQKTAELVRTTFKGGSPGGLNESCRVLKDYYVTRLYTRTQDRMKIGLRLLHLSDANLSCQYVLILRPKLNNEFVNSSHEITHKKNINLKFPSFSRDLSFDFAILHSSNVAILELSKCVVAVKLLHNGKSMTFTCKIDSKLNLKL